MYGPNDHWPEDVAYWLHLVGSWAYPTDEERALMAGCRPRREDPTLPDEYGIPWKLALPEGR